MSSKSPLPKLPTIGELLNHPRVQGLVTRINQTTVATRAAEFFEEIRAGLVDRATGTETPSLTHLAERFVRRILGDAGDGKLLINATGIVVGHSGLMPPLAESAIYEILQLGSEYHGRLHDVRREASDALCRAVGAEAALVTATFDGAVTLALSAVASGADLIVRGGDAAGSDLDWQKLAVQSGAILRGDDYSDAAVVCSAPEACLSTPGRRSADDHGNAGALLVDVAPLAGIYNPNQYDLGDVPTLAERLAAGVDLVVARGDGLLGGPDCGVVVGGQEAVARLCEHALYPALAAPIQTAAALRATLRIYETPARVAFDVPVWQLLSTPLENLQQRAERLAPLASEHATIASAEAVQCESPWAMVGGTSLTGRSWALRIEPAGGQSPASLEADLRRRAVVSRLGEEGLWLDLRAVFARWDQRLIAEAGGASEQPGADDSPESS